MIELVVYGHFDWLMPKLEKKWNEQDTALTPWRC